MAKVRIELNEAGVRDELLKSPQIQAVCMGYANRIQAKCGAGYSINTHTGPNRVNVMVYAETKEAIKDNLENNTLLKAL